METLNFILVPVSLGHRVECMPGLSFKKTILIRLFWVPDYFVAIMHNAIIIISIIIIIIISIIIILLL